MENMTSIFFNELISVRIVDDMNAKFITDMYFSIQEYLPIWISIIFCLDIT